MVGQPYVLDSMAVAVIGGTSVNGGEGGFGCNWSSFHF